MKFLLASLIALAIPATANANGISAGIADTKRNVTITFTCDHVIDFETGELVGTRCYSRMNRYCNEKTWRCSRVAPWMRGTRTR